MNLSKGPRKGRPLPIAPAFQPQAPRKERKRLCPLPKSLRSRLARATISMRSRRVVPFWHSFRVGASRFTGSTWWNMRKPCKERLLKQCLHRKQSINPQHEASRGILWGLRWIPTFMHLRIIRITRHMLHMRSNSRMLSKRNNNTFFNCSSSSTTNSSSRGTGHRTQHTLHGKVPWKCQLLVKLLQYVGMETK